MPIRKKTMIERFFSWNRHARRSGSSDVLNCSMSIEEMSHKRVAGIDQVQTRGSCRELQGHIQHLRGEFVGRTELELRHATLIVLIRRGYQTKKVYGCFQELWQEAEDVLLENLNLRWLVSAADTIADCDPDPTQRALALSASCLINTVKLSESERFLTGTRESEFLEDRVRDVQEGLVPFVEGMSCFTVGTDDTLRNLRWRIDSMDRSGVAGRILSRSFVKVQECESVYSRFRKAHTRRKTSWWD